MQWRSRLLLQCAIISFPLWFVITKSLNSNGSFSLVRPALRDCFIAEIMILYILSFFMVCFSVFLHRRGVISSVPISTHFSMNHSNLSGFLTGDDFMRIVPFSKVSFIFGIFTEHFIIGIIIRPSCRFPFPSIIFMMSPFTSSFFTACLIPFHQVYKYHL